MRGERHPLKHSPGTPGGRFSRKLSMVLAACLLALSLGRPARSAGPPFLIRDINTTANHHSDSRPQKMLAIGTTLYFVADDGNRGPELWRSDGTAAGTTRVKDINPGKDGSDPS